jgi:hypothetical protein
VTKNEIVGLPVQQKNFKKGTYKIRQTGAIIYFVGKKRGKEHHAH